MKFPELFDPLTEEEIDNLQKETGLRRKLIPILFDYYNRDRYVVQISGITRKSFLISFECWCLVD